MAIMVAFDAIRRNIYGIDITKKKAHKGEVLR